MTRPLLSIENLSIAFSKQGESRTVVTDLSLQIQRGETLALVGESGSGKSVSALSVLRLLPSPPVSYPQGDILFHGQSLLNADEQTLRGIRGNTIAMIFQEPMVSLHCIRWKNSSMKCCHFIGECVKRQRGGKFWTALNAPAFVMRRNG